MKSAKIFEDIFLINRKTFVDDRGEFIKLFDRLPAPLSGFDIQQCNYVRSEARFTIRGLHFQTGTFAESKLFSVLDGKVQLCVLDIRPHSSSFLKSEFFILDKSTDSILVPRGFATGYCTLEDNSTVLYFSDNNYNAEFEQGVRWNDAVIKQEWLTSNPVLSEKDKLWPNFTV